VRAPRVCVRARVRVRARACACACARVRVRACVCGGCMHACKMFHEKLTKIQ